MTNQKFKSIGNIKDLDFHIYEGTTLYHVSENGISEIEYIDRSTYSFNFINARFTDNSLYVIKLKDIHIIVNNILKPTKSEMKTAQIWDNNIFLIKYLFLITELNYSRENANNIANTKFKKLSLIDKMELVKYLQK